MRGVKSVEFLDNSECIRVRYHTDVVNDGVAKPYGMDDSIKTFVKAYDDLVDLPGIPQNLEDCDVYRIGIPQRGTLAFVFDRNDVERDAGPYFERE